MRLGEGWTSLGPRGDESSKVSRALSARLAIPVFQPGQTVPGWYKYWEYAFLDSGGLFIIVLIGAGVLAVSTRLRKTRRGNSSTAAESGPPAGLPDLKFNAA